MRVALPDITLQEAIKQVKNGIRMWRTGAPYLDQGDTPHCVGYGFTHGMNAAPVGRTLGSVFAEKIYARALQLDEFPGEEDSGTSVRAGAKALLEQNLGCEYRWGIFPDGSPDFDAIQIALLVKGVVVVGTSWMTKMFYPDPKGLLSVTGSDEGGHCYAITGIDMKKKRYRIRNSWGHDWGIAGSAWIEIDAMHLLLSNEGEACIILDKPAVKK